MRLRFAPSPTGALHIGGARTALFNWLAARHTGGQLVLRIEDTDRERSTPEHVEQILDALRWLELDWDEGPIFQTERADRHQQALRQLLDSGHAYRSTATAADVKAYKEQYGAERGFRGEDEGEGAIRLRVPEAGATVVRDLIRGETRFEHSHLDDPVIARADGTVLYNFAVAVDDLDAAITHVVRGDDHLSNTPKQLLVLQALQAPQPLYAHLPLLHGPDGKKLSKRHGAASVQELRDAGYLPEAVRNYLALLGWGTGDDQTVLSTAELVQRFTLERVSRNPARVDETKLRWLNGVQIRSMDVAQLTQHLRRFAAQREPNMLAAADAQPDRFAAAVAISQEKIHALAEFWPLCAFLFEEPTFDPAAVERWLDDTGASNLEHAVAALQALQRFDQDGVRQALTAVIERLGAKPRDVYQPLRVALSGGTISPGIFESLALLGRERTLARAAAALQRVKRA